MQPDLLKKCPKCYFENPAEKTICEFCGWQLLDEEGSETVFEGQPLSDTQDEPGCSGNSFNLGGELAHFKVQQVLGTGGLVPCTGRGMKP